MHIVYYGLSELFSCIWYVLFSVCIKMHIYKVQIQKKCIHLTSVWSHIEYRISNSNSVSFPENITYKSHFESFFIATQIRTFIVKGRNSLLLKINYIIYCTIMNVCVWIIVTSSNTDVYINRYWCSSVSHDISSYSSVKISTMSII